MRLPPAVQDSVRKAADCCDTGRCRLIFDQRGAALISGKHCVIERHDALNWQSVAAGEVPDGLLITGSAHLVGDHLDLLDAEILGQRKRSAGRLQRLEIWLADDQQRIDVTRSATAEMFKPGFQIDDGCP